MGSTEGAFSCAAVYIARGSTASGSRSRRHLIFYKVFLWLAQYRKYFLRGSKDAHGMSLQGACKEECTKQVKALALTVWNADVHVSYLSTGVRCSLEDGL